MLAELGRMLVRWRSVFPRHITWVRAVSLLLGLIVAVGRRTVTASLLARGRRFLCWAADYLVFSRAGWEVLGLFKAVLDLTLETCDRLTPGGYLVVAVDDTSIRKTGKHIASARWMRDPQSPPFHLNLRWGLRYLHLCVILPLHRLGHDPRAVSIGFEPAPALKKPGKSASPQQLAEYLEAKKTHNLSHWAVAAFQRLRAYLDATGQALRTVLMVTDASYMNATVLAGLPQRVEIVGRTRSDLALCQAAPPGGRKVYGQRLPTPEALRQDTQLPWAEALLHYAGARRSVRFKEVNHVLWPRGGKRRLLRLLIVAPTPYRAAGKGRRRWYYREPAYLLTTDLSSPAEQLLQAYFDRWQIELEHRDLKTGLGVGHAQVWNDKSVERLPPAHVAMWSMVKLAALRTHGPTRTDAYPPRPAWYPQQPGDRASQQDIVQALRSDLLAHPSALHWPPQRPPKLPSRGPQPASLPAQITTQESVV